MFSRIGVLRSMGLLFLVSGVAVVGVVVWFCGSLTGVLGSFGGGAWCPGRA